MTRLSAHIGYLYAELLDDRGQTIMGQSELYVPPKHFSWPKPTVTTEFRDTDDGVSITVRADCFAKGVCLDFAHHDCVLSDNFFDLTGPEACTVTIRTEYSAEELEKDLTVKTVYDIR